MKKLVIRFFVDGKVKRFTAPRIVSWDTLRRTMAMQKIFDSAAPNDTVIPQCYPLLCSIFGYQFTEEQLQRGYDVREILKKTSEALHYIIATASLSTKGEVLPFESKRKRSAKTYFN